MSNSGLGISKPEWNETLHIPGYHFKASSVSTLAHGENVNLVHGYKISTKRAVVAKLSPNALQLEREFYVMKRLYQATDGSSFIVCPMEYLSLTDGISVAIYANEGQSYLTHRRSSDDLYLGYTTMATDTGRSAPRNETRSTAANVRAWLKSRCSAEDLSGDIDLPAETLAMQSYKPSLDLTTFLQFAIKCTDCLEFIHRNNVIHGEIRLSSFMWDGDDTRCVKIWNFGTGSKTPLEPYLTSEGWRKTALNKDLISMLQSVLAYMSPEQTGRTTHAPDYRSDIYSLGVVFFVLLTGGSPFDGGPLEILNGVLSRKLPLVHEMQGNVPEAVAQIVEKMTNKTPNDRYSSAHGLRSDLKECLRQLEDGPNPGAIELIQPFALAQNDIVSIFTLPKTIYGRETVLSRMNEIIAEFVAEYNPNRKRHNNRTPPAASVSTRQTYQLSNIGSNADSQSDDSRPEDRDGSIRSASSPSYFSGIAESETANAISIPGSYQGKNTLQQKLGTVVVSLYGPGGIGKSTMLAAMHATARQSGYIAVSKFDSRNKVPYSCVLRSLSQILQQILSESEEEIKLFYEHLKTQLGAQFCNCSLLTDFVPELRVLLDPTSSTIREDEKSEEDVHLDNVETQARFQNLFIEVFRAISNWCMTTLFLDDLHQADDHSLELLESLMISKIKILIFISYRDQEITAKLRDVLESGACWIRYIEAEPLDINSTADFLCDALHRSGDKDREQIFPLAEVVLKKTNGNAFYTTQLLQTLNRKKLIFFNWQKNEWDYHLDEIRDGAIYSMEPTAELDVSFLVARLRELPRESQTLLKWASYVGDTFTWTMVKDLLLTSTTFEDQSDDDDDSELSFDDTSSAETARYACTNSTSTAVDFPNQFDDNSCTSHIQKKKSLVRPAVYRNENTFLGYSNRQKSYSSRDPIVALQAVLQEGYIMTLGPDEFKWGHDRIAQAAGELASQKTRNKMHLTIAQYLMKEHAVNSFLAADHLLKCFEILDALEDKKQYRRLLIDAGNKGRSSGAHRMAFAYYSAAIKLGDPAIEWAGKNYTTTLHLYTNAVALSLIAGQDKTEELLKTIFKNAHTSIDRVTAFRIQAKFYFGCQMHDKGMEALHRCLEDLGEERCGSTITDEELKRKFDEVEQQIKVMGREKMVAMPTCNDPLLKGILSVLEELCTVAYWSDEKKEMYYCAVRIVKLSLAHGVSPVTSVGCTFAGIGYATLYKKYIFSEEIGAIGLQLVDKHGGKYEKGRVYMQYPVFVVRWNYHHREGLKYFEAGIRFSLSAGDRIYVAFHQTHRLVILFGLNSSITDTLHEAESNFEDIHTWSSSVDTNMFAMCIIRACKALQGHTYVNTPDVFDGDDGFNNEHYVAESLKHSSNPELILNWYDAFKIIPQTLYGHTDAAIATGYNGIDIVDDHPCHRHTRILIHYFSVALMDKLHVPDLDPEERQKLLDRVERNQELVLEWAEHSVVNYMMFWTLIAAELTSLEDSKKAFIKAIRLYEDAINQAREGGWHLELCVAHERAAGFYYRNEVHNVAYALVSRAIDLYMAHGSYGKAQHLSIKYLALIDKFCNEKTVQHDVGVQTDIYPIFNTQGRGWSESSPESIGISQHIETITDTGVLPPVTTEQTLMTLDILDMASILKSSQVMSSEVRFDGLLTSMMTIIFENSGADCGAIIVKDEKYGVCAYGKEGAINTYHPPLPLSEKDGLISSRIVHHTINTGESIFIHDVEQDQRFAIGPWFERTGKKSVICMPIIHKCSVPGCLIIEGGVGIFTQRHITVLSLLCQQMGISITNAFLFKSVQRVTEANMRMIEMQKQALEEARRSKEAADRATRLRELFLANMSHEIRTPFSGFYGMISLLAETELDSEQQDLVKTAKESCEMLLRIIDDLLNFSKLQAGKVSLDLTPVVVEDMITDVIEMLIAMAIKKRINVTYTVANDVPSVVMADANRMRQIIINLLGNAIKFTHEGEIIIRCSVAKAEGVRKLLPDDKVSLLFEIIDTGIGISEEQRKALFVPFSQVDGSTTRKYGGTGLGLSICLQLVQLMSGRIDVHSVPGKGSNFNFTIHVSRMREKSKKRNSTIDTLLNNLRDTRILVAGAHISTVAMIKQLLPGVVVDGACSVHELLTQQTVSYDILIIGLFLTSDLQFKEWWEHLQKFIDRVRCVVVMHYPSGVIGEILGKIMEDGSSLGAPVHQLERHAVTRIAVPIRRQRLLRTMVDMFQQTIESLKPRTSIPVKTKANNRGAVTSEEHSLFSTMHILAAEDNPVAQKLLYKQLTRLGFQVDCANNGAEVVEAWAGHAPGYYKMGFFDHHMPRCDGIEATKKIRKIEADEQRPIRFPIVALTADIQESAREACIKAGMDGYLTKPLNQKVLSEVLRRYCKDPLGS